MTVVPAGTIVLGSHVDEAYRTDYERPKQKASIAKPFAMATHEVTLGEFRTFMMDSAYEQVPMRVDGVVQPGCNYFDGKRYGFIYTHSWQNSGYAQHEDTPVVCVSWSDATAYAVWLTEKTGRAYRVPSSVEFEYALRAGENGPWPWGNNPDKACEYANIADRTFAHRFPERANFDCNDGYLYVSRVGQFQPNALGLYDMIGNAWEWTDDCFHKDMTDAPLDGSPWLDDGGADCAARTPKGGSWLSGPGWARAATRSADGMHYRSFMLGFRVAAELR